MLGIVIAMKKEFSTLEKEFILGKKETIGMTEFYIGTINNKKVVIGFCGVGKVNAAVCTQLLITKYEATKILNFGIAGSLTKELCVGDIFIANAIYQHDFDTTAFGEPKGWVEELNTNRLETDKCMVEEMFSMQIPDMTLAIGSMVSGDKFIEKIAHRNKLRRDFFAMTCDMESGAIAQVCLQNQIPFAVVKSISDSFEENSTENYQANLDLSVEKINQYVVKYIHKIL